MSETDAGKRPDEPVSVSDDPSPTSATPSDRQPGPTSADDPRDTADTSSEASADRNGGTEGTHGSSDDRGPSRRRGSRGGRNRNRPRAPGDEAGSSSRSPDGPSAVAPSAVAPSGDRPSDAEGERAASDAARPRIGDSRPAPAPDAEAPSTGGRSGPGGPGPKSSGQGGAGGGPGSSGRRRRRRGGRGRGGPGGGDATRRSGGQAGQGGRADQGDQAGQRKGRGGGRAEGRSPSKPGDRTDNTDPITAITDDVPVDLDEETLAARRGRERKGRPVGRYLMAVHVQPNATQIAVLEGRSLMEHYVSRPADAVAQIHGNIYLAKVQNVLPGMEAAFVDIGTPKNAVLYRSDTRHDPDELDQKRGDLRIEQILKARQTIVCQVTKNPIGAKGARLTQEVSIPGRFVVLVPNSSTYGISKRLPDNERKRLRQILDGVRPPGHGLIVRTAAEGISAEELERDVGRLAEQWERIEALAARSQAPTLLYQEPDMAVRVIREEFNQDYRQVVIDDDTLYEEVRDYVRSISPALVERVQRYDPAEHGGLPIYETHRVHEQLHKALDRKVWLPSGGSLIIERTEALTVIDVNTGKNVGTSNLEETVFRNNLEAAEEVARQLRLRDIGGIIVIDFIDMEIKANREKVIATFRQALALDKTRTQVFDISELGLVEMTRKRIGEGLIESLSAGCPTCDGRGLVFDTELIGE